MVAVLHCNGRYGQRYLQAGVLRAANALPRGVDRFLAVARGDRDRRVLHTRRYGFIYYSIFFRTAHRGKLNPAHADGIHTRGDRGLFAEKKLRAPDVRKRTESIIDNNCFFHS